MDADWVRKIRRKCKLQGVPFFFKQWGGRNKKAAGRILDGRTWDEMPVATVRQKRRKMPMNGPTMIPAIAG